MKKQLVFILMSLLFVATTYAQRTVTVQGVVTDANFNEPVIGANILVKGTTLGTICDVDGKYLLENVPANGTLVFSFIGMKTVEVKVDGKKTINVELSDDVQKLEDVVVIGYGTSKAKDLTAPISVVKSDQIASQATTSPMSALQGKVPGMNVVASGTPGSGPKVTIRGLGSFGDTSPLYVVDGMFYDNLNSATL
ncbi:tonB-linked outer membrane protein SusC/RagA family [Bacteroides sp. CAG:1076]|nr:tonB-linked outer membrane protein SusC/RagA family [Bacteroides sp. CAG:1076]